MEAFSENADKRWSHYKKMPAKSGGKFKIEIYRIFFAEKKVPLKSVAISEKWRQKVEAF